jgi:hypothetical protein
LTYNNVIEKERLVNTRTREEVAPYGPHTFAHTCTEVLLKKVLVEALITKKTQPFYKKSCQKMQQAKQTPQLVSDDKGQL